MRDLERERVEQAFIDGSIEGSPIDRDGNRIDRRTLADAILAISIGELDWHAGQIVKGEEDSALALARLIGAEYDRLAGPQVSELTLFLNALANTARLTDEERAAFLRKMGR